MSSILTTLKDAIAASKPIELHESSVNIAGEPYARDLETSFQAEDPEPWIVDLQSIVHAWLSRSKSLADYIISCEDVGVRNLKFAERADLLSWLEGKSDESEYIQVQEKSDAKRDISQVYQPIYDHEKILTDHNMILEGSKRIDFSSASKECHKLIMGEFRRNQRFNSSTPAANSSNGAPGSSSSSSSSSSKTKLKEPIIILSPSPSSLINMANIKEFLESGTFEPTTRSASTSAFARLSRESPNLGKMRFFVVDNVDRFKPEYWDRVVAVFVTGQSWQLKPYKWSDPNHLFSHVMGFSVNYKGDPIPQALKGWNVAIEEVERTKRFKDHEVVERIWERLENHMLARGWGKK